MIKMNVTCDCRLPNPKGYFLLRCRIGFSLVEVIVVMAIVGVLTSTLLVAIQAARESARKLNCGNNLRQIGLAVQAHENSRQHYPTNGWGWRLIPDAIVHPRYGQAGGWLFQLLPYLEHTELHDLTIASSPSNVAISNKQRLLTTPVTVFNCPNRTTPIMVKQNTDPEFYLNLSPPPEAVASADYAVNGGTYSIFPKKHPSEQGPEEMGGAYLDRFPWATSAQNNGAAFMQVRLRSAEFRRGTTNVLWAAERYINANQPPDVDDGGNDQSMYSGHCSDTTRFTAQPPRSNHRSGDRRVFGSAHATGIIGVLMDGSVQEFSFDIEDAIFRAYGRRNDTHLPVLDL